MDEVSAIFVNFCYLRHDFQLDIIPLHVLLMLQAACWSFGRRMETDEPS